MTYLPMYENIIFYFSNLLSEYITHGYIFHSLFPPPIMFTEHILTISNINNIKNIAFMAP